MLTLPATVEPGTRICGSLGLLKPHQLEAARRCHKETNRYAGPLPRWARCFLPVHNADQEHVGSLRHVPEEFGGGCLAVTWGRDPLHWLRFYLVHPLKGYALDLTPPLVEVRGVPVPGRTP
jgi:hypothetical protein